MKRLIFVTISLLMLAALPASALPAFNGINYSGSYDCQGENQQVGKYRLEVTLKLNLVSSTGRTGVYEYTAETENSVKFYGNAVIRGNQMAASYVLDTSRRKDEPTTGLAAIKRDASGRWTFLNHYFEPDDFGGNYGTETCVMQKKKAAVKAAE